MNIIIDETTLLSISLLKIRMIATYLKVKIINNKTNIH